jgi:hypothetical protein
MLAAFLSKEWRHGPMSMRELHTTPDRVLSGGRAAREHLEGARGLNVSQPSISHAIGELEALWNEKLFSACMCKDGLPLSEQLACAVPHALASSSAPPSRRDGAGSPAKIASAACSRTRPHGRSRGLARPHAAPGNPNYSWGHRLLSCDLGILIHFTCDKESMRST